jgi:hypothetical protein
LTLRLCAPPQQPREGQLLSFALSQPLSKRRNRRFLFDRRLPAKALDVNPFLQFNLQSRVEVVQAGISVVLGAFGTSQIDTRIDTQKKAAHHKNS